MRTAANGARIFASEVSTQILSEPIESLELRVEASEAFTNRGCFGYGAYQYAEPVVHYERTFKFKKLTSEEVQNCRQERKLGNFSFLNILTIEN